MSKTFPIAKEMSNLDKSMDQFLTRLDKLKHDEQDFLKQLPKEKNDILKEIGDLRKKINDHLDRMEKSLVSEVESRFAGKIQSTNRCVENFSNMTSSVAKIRKTLQDARDINDAEMFVQIKQGKENLREHESLMKKFSSEVEVRSVKLFPNSIKDVLLNEKDNIFGRIKEIICPKLMQIFGDYTVRLQSDKKNCLFTDVCLTTGGCIVCTDYSNNKLKKLDSSYNVIEHLDMPSTPACLCEVESTQLAVTLRDDKKVQFVTQQPLKLVGCFTVGDCCRGKDCHDGKLFVCCGGENNEGPGHIEVYNINGGLLRSFYEDLIFPVYIKAAADGELFVGERRSNVNKLLKVNTYDFSMSEMHIKRLTNIGGFCRIGEGQLCVSGWSTNNIVLMSEDGEQHQELLTVKKGIVKPWGVFFNEKLSQLVVVLEDLNDAIKVYDVIT